MIKFPRILFGDIHEHILEIEKTINDREAFLICDENTSICREKLANTTLHNIPFLTILSGESNKTLEQVSIIWKFLNDHNAKRNSILFSLGGGVLCDLGGFAAATYKRGIQFINIPTSLLAMVDASIGGKTGFNFHNLKNNIGTFTQPEMILCDVNFLTTLPVIELKSGMAEVFKHAIIGDQSMWNYLKSTNFNNLDYNYIVKRSSEIKEKIVKKDPHEKSQRKVLNFGHTIGHAIETSSLNKNKPNLHGYAIAKGMIIESFISYQLNNISKNEFL